MSRGIPSQGHSDVLITGMTSTCRVCQHVWDTNDPDPPACDAVDEGKTVEACNRIEIPVPHFATGPLGLRIPMGALTPENLEQYISSERQLQLIEIAKSAPASALREAIRQTVWAMKTGVPAQPE